MNLQITKREYVPHPEGRHRGRISGVVDKGEVGNKTKVAVNIESETAFMNDGTPFRTSEWFTKSSHRNSKLWKFTESLTGRKPGPKVDISMLKEELVGRSIEYSVVHRKSSGGGTLSNITYIRPVDRAKNGSEEKN